MWRISKHFLSIFYTSPNLMQSKKDLHSEQRKNFVAANQESIGLLHGNLGDPKICEIESQYPEQLPSLSIASV